MWSRDYRAVVGVSLPSGEADTSVFDRSTTPGRPTGPGHLTAPSNPVGTGLPPGPDLVPGSDLRPGPDLPVAPGLPERFRWSNPTAAAATGAAASGPLALLLARILPEESGPGAPWWPVAAVLVVTEAAVGVLAWRVWAARAGERSGADGLIRFGTSLRDAAGTGAVAHLLITHCLRLFPVRRAAVLLALPGGDTAWCWWAGDGEPGGPVPAPVDLARMEVLLAVPPGRIRPANSVVGDRLLAAWALREALVLPLPVGDGTRAVLLIGDTRRRGRPGRYPVNLRLARALADQATVALRHAHARERLRHDALHDALTGLPNRTGFRVRAVEAADEAAAGHGPCAIGVLDLDGFKTVNDSLGHLAGDQVLAEVGHRMAALSTDGLTVSRLGGDEFAVLIRGVADPDRAVLLAHRVLAALHHPFIVDGQQVRLSGSLGLTFAPRDGITADRLLRNADVAMYAAKAQSGGLQVYDRQLTDAVDAPLSLAADLRLALARGDLSIAVQPLVDLRTGRLHSVEALARWRHPLLGSVSPETFVQAAERGGLIGELTDLVVDTALGWCRAWRAGGLEVQVAVNLAARTLSDPRLADTIASALRRNGLPGHLLCLELTETGVITDPDRALAVLGRLRDLGVSIAVDDFGTGYSSLAYLKWLSPDQLKIDKGFVQRLRFEPRSEAIVRSIIQLGRGLGVDVVAEGVGDPRTATMLSDLDCTLGQGYLFAEPMPPSELPDWVTRWMDVPERDDTPVSAAVTDPRGIDLRGADRRGAGPQGAVLRATDESVRAVVASWPRPLLAASQTPAGPPPSGSPLPGLASPGSSVPGASVPGQAMPEQAVPGHATPEPAMSEQAVPGQAMPEPVVSEPAVPGSPVPEQVLPEQAMPGRPRPEPPLPGRPRSGPGPRRPERGAGNP
jgi:diguanylate cyclase (GGDEF)-like protein